MTKKQMRFIEEYLVDLNATAAAKRAGYSELTAYKTGSENLKKPQIKAALDQAMFNRSQRTEITADQVLHALSLIAFADIADLFDDNFKLKKLNDIPEDKRKMIAGIEIKHDMFGNVTTKVRTNDRIRALELIGKHLGMFKDRIDITSGDKAITGFKVEIIDQNS